VYTLLPSEVGWTRDRVYPIRYSTDGRPAGGRDATR